jgi:hypothetical protein
VQSRRGPTGPGDRPTDPSGPGRCPTRSSSTPCSRRVAPPEGLYGRRKMTAHLRRQGPGGHPRPAHRWRPEASRSSKRSWMRPRPAGTTAPLASSHRYPRAVPWSGNRRLGRRPRDGAARPVRHHPGRAEGLTVEWDHVPRAVARDWPGSSGRRDRPEAARRRGADARPPQPIRPRCRVAAGVPGRCPWSPGRWT